MSFTEGAVISSFEIVLPKNVLEACYKLLVGEGTEFLASNVHKRTTSRIKLQKQSDSSVRIKLAVHCWKETETLNEDVAQPQNIKVEHVQRWADEKELSAEPYSMCKQPSPEKVKMLEKTLSCLSGRPRAASAEPFPAVGITPMRETDASVMVQKVEVHMPPGEQLSVLDMEDVMDCDNPKPDESIDEQLDHVDGEDGAGDLTVDETPEVPCKVEPGTEQRHQCTEPLHSQRPSNTRTEKQEDKVLRASKHLAPGSGNSDSDNVEQNESDRELAASPPKSETVTLGRCRYCGSVCKNASNLYIHVRNKHPEAEGVEGYLSELHELRKTMCEVCQKQYSSKVQLDVHTRTMHMAQDQAKCPTCGVTVKSQSHLKNHTRRSHAVRKQDFLCHLCPASFKVQSYLNDHLKHVHTTNAKDIHACNQCDFTTTSRKYLRGHRFRVHSGRKHVCPHCQKAFSLVPNMKRHIELVHSKGKTRYTCPECAKTFSVKANLKEHINSIHLKRFTFKCDLCDTGFRRRKELEVHQQLHQATSLQLHDIITRLGVAGKTDVLTPKAKQVNTSASDATGQAPPENMGKDVNIADCSTVELSQDQVAKSEELELEGVQFILVTQPAADKLQG